MFCKRDNLSTVSKNCHYCYFYLGLQLASPALKQPASFQEILVLVRKYLTLIPLYAYPPASFNQSFFFFVLFFFFLGGGRGVQSTYRPINSARLLSKIHRCLLPRSLFTENFEFNPSTQNKHIRPFLRSNPHLPKDCVSIVSIKAL